MTIINNLATWANGTDNTNIIGASISANQLAVASIAAGSIPISKIITGETNLTTSWPTNNHMIGDYHKPRGPFAETLTVTSETVIWTVALPGIDPSTILFSEIHHDDNGLTKLNLEAPNNGKTFLDVPEEGCVISTYQLVHGMLTVKISRPYTEYVLDL